MRKRQTRGRLAACRPRWVASRTQTSYTRGDEPSLAVSAAKGQVTATPAPKPAGSRRNAYADQEAGRIELEALADLKRAGASLHGVHIEFVIQFGEPVEEIVREAHAAGASLVAMATHRRNGIARIVKGSVAEQIERGTAIPVILVQYGEGSAA